MQRAACEEFILHCTNVVAQPILALIEQASEAKAASPQKLGRLKDDDVLHALSRAEQATEESLLPAHALMVRYLPDPSTQGILFTPVKTNVMDAFGQLQTLVNAMEISAERREALQLSRPSLCATRLA
ncbi:MAG: hypothetical protein SGPRY_010245, partial [Prymnesium sp.]